MKVFNTFDSEIVLDCQYFCGSLPLEHLARIRKVNFLVNMESHDNSVIRIVHALSINEELKPIANFYQVEIKELAFKCGLLAINSVISRTGLNN